MGLTGHCKAQIESNYDEVTDSFDSMNLKSELLRGVYAYGFERPSAIQQRAIMPVIKGENCKHTEIRSTFLTINQAPMSLRKPSQVPERQRLSRSPSYRSLILVSKLVKP